MAIAVQASRIRFLGFADAILRPSFYCPKQPIDKLCHPAHPPAHSPIHLLNAPSNVRRELRTLGRQYVDIVREAHEMQVSHQQAMVEREQEFQSLLQACQDVSSEALRSVLSETGELRRQCTDMQQLQVRVCAAGETWCTRCIAVHVPI